MIDSVSVFVFFLEPTSVRDVTYLHEPPGPEERAIVMELIDLLAAKYTASGDADEYLRAESAAANEWWQSQEVA
jgi:hypothetical protein